MHRGSLAGLAATGLLLSAPLPSQADWHRIESLGQHSLAASAYDAARQRVVLFGGTLSDGAAEPERTWLWNGMQWSTPGPASQLPKLQGAAMAYDSQRQRVVLFGGASLPPPHYPLVLHNDTWEWDGANWLPTNPATRPPERQRHAMAYDSARGCTVMVAGSGAGTGGSFVHTDTWEWNGSNWLLRSNASPGGDGPAMAYDAARGQSVLFVAGSVPSAGAQTWLWSGNAWTQAAGVQPPPRQSAVMAYDPGSQSVLLTGGGYFAGGSPAPDLWRWNGATWQQLTVPANAPARYGAASAWDTGRGALVVSGGYDAAGNHSDTWEWNGVQWRQADPEGTPQGYGQAVTYDSIRDRVVMFGGVAYTTYYDQTWEFDGNRWALRSPATMPPARSGAAMAFDRVLGEAVMFGGASSSGVQPVDTWVYDGIDWRLRNPVVHPSARVLHSMTHDARRKRILMFGGDTSAETWEWNGSNWLLRTTAHAPRPRYEAGLAYDVVRDRSVLFGGSPATGPSYFDLNDTWEWDGTDWTQRLPAVSPGIRDGVGMVYDEVRERVVLFGGLNTNPWVTLSDTWEWDGTVWQARMPVDSPPPLCTEGMVFDSARGRVLLQGGRNPSGMPLIQGSTWTWSTPTPGTAVPFGAGCAGTAGVPQLGTGGRRPWLGDSYTVVGSGLPANALTMLAIGLSATAWSGGALPFPLGGIGMPGCSLLVRPDVTTLALASTGTCRVTTPIPNRPQLLGQIVYHQLAVLDPPANSAGIVTSAGLRSQIGQR